MEFIFSTDLSNSIALVGGHVWSGVHIAKSGEVGDRGVVDEWCYLFLYQVLLNLLAWNLYKLTLHTNSFQFI